MKPLQHFDSGLTWADSASDQSSNRQTAGPFGRITLSAVAAPCTTAAFIDADRLSWAPGVDVSCLTQWLLANPAGRVSRFLRLAR